ncbi:MAG: hypothetical protein V7637_343 [Mycobacteriales bacterium]
MLPVLRNRDRRRDRRPELGRHEPARQDVGELVARVAGSDQPDRRAPMLTLARALGGSARVAGVRAVAAGRWLADVLAEAAPRIPVRDAPTLAVHHPGKTTDQIAEALVKQAALVTAGFGAAAGGLAAAEFFTPPALLAAPVQLAAETLAIAAVEIKLVAELHELYGEPVHGGVAQRGSAYLMSWVRQRAVEPAVAGSGLAAVLGHAAKRELRSRLLRRVGRSTTSMAPFLAGAVAGAEVNRRATRSLGEKVGAELRGRRQMLPG